MIALTARRALAALVSVLGWSGSMFAVGVDILHSTFKCKFAETANWKQATTEYKQQLWRGHLTWASKDAGSATPACWQFPQNMPVQVLAVVTTHNSIISTARSWRPLRKKIFLLPKKCLLPSLIYLRLSHPTDPPRDALQHPSREGGPASLRCNALLGGGLRPLRCCIGPT